MRYTRNPFPSSFFSKYIGTRHNLLHFNMSHPGKSGIVSALTWVCRRCLRPHPPPGLRNPNKQSLLLVTDVRVKPSPRGDSPDDSGRLETTRGRSRRLGNSDDVITAVVESPARSQGPAVRRPPVEARCQPSRCRGGNGYNTVVWHVECGRSDTQAGRRVPPTARSVSSVRNTVEKSFHP